MSIIGIAAVSKDGYISKNNSIPWDFPVDKKQWTHMVRDSPVIMGRKTFEQVPVRLTSDHIYVLSRTESYPDKSYATACRSKEDVLEHISMREQTVYVLGGGAIYELFYEDMDTLILTEVDKTVDGDARFPMRYTQDFTPHVRITFANRPFEIVYYNR